MARRCLILGITGQDGSYLADILLEQGAEVHGMVRKSSVDNLTRILHCQDRVVLHRGDMADPLSIDRIIRDVAPHEIYNEADQDNVGWSHDIPQISFDVTCGAVGRLFEIVRRYDKSIKIFQPVTAMMFGEASESPQNEKTGFNPQSPYACSKVAAYYLSRHYRLKYDIPITTGILYNHDSVRRSEDYLVHKICRSVLKIAAGTQQYLSLSFPERIVDVGLASQYMNAAVSLLKKAPDDYIIGTGCGATIREIAARAMSYLVIPETCLRWETLGGEIQFPLVADLTKTQSTIADFMPTPTIEVPELLLKRMIDEKLTAKI